MDQEEHIVAKRCPECQGEPQYVHYYIPEKAGGAFDFEEDEELHPMILFKRLECKDCGATVPNLVLSCDDAVKYWNEEVDGHRLVLSKYGTEPVYHVEPKSNEKTLEK